MARKKEDRETGEIILYGGIIIIAYYMLKSWGVIQPMLQSTSKLKYQYKHWNPLSETELRTLKSKIERLPPSNPGDIYYEDKFETRTGRGRMGRYGFIGNLK